MNPSASGTRSIECLSIQRTLPPLPRLGQGKCQDYLQSRSVACTCTYRNSVLPTNLQIETGNKSSPQFTAHCSTLPRTAVHSLDCLESSETLHLHRSRITDVELDETSRIDEEDDSSSISESVHLDMATHLSGAPIAELRSHDSELATHIIPQIQARLPLDRGRGYKQHTHGSSAGSSQTYQASESSGVGTLGANSKPRGQKGDQGSEDNDSQDGNDDIKRHKPPSSGDPDSRPAFLCPFNKRYPQIFNSSVQKYRACSGPGYTEVRRFKWVESGLLVLTFDANAACS